ncbi:MAG: tetratricopeptide repeat protein [Candidatus Omnitrophota bacterium]
MTKQKQRLLFILFSAFSLQLSAFSFQLRAQEPDSGRLKQLEEQILANPKDSLSLSKLEELSSLYLEGHQYNQLVDFLRKQELIAVSGCELPLGYYIGLCRYHQLRYLEETKNWQEYFDRGGLYREELFQETMKTVSLCPESPLAIKAQVINWLEHKAQNDSLGKDALDKLISSLNNYVRQLASGLSSLEGEVSPPGLDMEVIKETADILQREGEPALARAAYNIYVGRLDDSKTTMEELRLAAESALESGNISLAEIIYERYINGIKLSFSKEDLAKELTVIAEQFRFKDMAYAEKISTILEDSCGTGCFSDELQYARAYNLQRLRDYSKAIQEYEKLVKNFPASPRINEAEFKLGVLYTYIISQKEEGLNYWQKVIERDSDLILVVESLYHRALINQSGRYFDMALADYSKILERVNNNPDFKELTERVQIRQKEIQESKPIEYNLKTFLDLSLKKEGIIESQASALDLTAEPFKTIRDREIEFSLNQPQIMTGCLVPALIYLWSGDLGGIYPVPVTPEFSAAYQIKGVKVVNVVVLSALEPVGSALEMVDIDE